MPETVCHTAKTIIVKMDEWEAKTLRGYLQNVPQGTGPKQCDFFAELFEQLRTHLKD